ncbi:uncharacterized protein EI90DRAFT_3129665 [Cantharellus anzutake]|uniref:uncharacterized protein n=1 Tax=Cantharellus anzutake TaxID=1750568 RepID=UPI001905C1D9|nr:uncharacterized protein EI90DRAFT_3129665 [Cantharellus anzutake]KAF8324701.1 hypothetical protein EI90DRAFT_3129665 [Cantharellus anzutake]
MFAYFSKATVFSVARSWRASTTTRASLTSRSCNALRTVSAPKALSSTASRLNQISPLDTVTETTASNSIPSRTSPSEPSATLFVGNVPFHIADREVAALFENTPGFVEMKSPVDRRSKGYVFIAFSSLDLAKAAYQSFTLDPPTIGGRPLRFYYSNQNKSVITQPISNTVFIANLSPTVTEDIIRESFSKFGDIVQVHIARREGNRTVAWVKFSNESQAEMALNALQRKPIEPDGDPVRLDYAVNKDRDRDSPQKKPNERIFVSGFGAHPPEEVADAFKRFRVKSFKVATEPVTNQPRGYGWMDFETTADAMQAMDTLLTEKPLIGGVPLRLEYANIRKDNDKKQIREGRFKST